MKRWRETIDYHLMEVWAGGHPMESLRPELERRGFLSRAELPSMPSGALVKTGGLLVTVHTPPTRSGRRVMFITVEDETGLIDLVAFEDVQRRWAGAIFTAEILLVEGVLRRQGRDRKAISITIRRVMGPV